jgi:hypothetical protein
MQRLKSLRLVVLLVLSLMLVVSTGCEEDCPECLDAPDVVGETGDDVAETAPATWEGGLTIVTVYADEAGVSHFSDEEVGFQEVDYAPPALPMQVSATTPAAAYLFIEGGPDYDSGMHPSPARQLVIVLRGVAEVEVSDGEVRQFGAGSVIITEDLTGDGHITRAAGEGEGALLTAIPLPPAE